MDARRNLESVLRAAREVFGELGYGAPMEEVARRAGVGVGTVYRRFPSKEVLVRRIASEEVAWLTAQAREALHGSPDPWEALAGYLARAAANGAGRLLPPEAFRHAERISRAAGSLVTELDVDVDVPVGAGAAAGAGVDGLGVGLGLGLAAGVPDAAGGDGFALLSGSAVRVAGGGGEPDGGAENWADADPAALLALLGELVERAAAAGELRPGVTVADVVLVLTAAVPAYPALGDPGDTPLPGGPGSPAGRLLRILLDGLRAR
ncbi:TetR/AcrR family transcriptional regulator [Streptomyces sp. NPDC092296]|uniref:TetR/AcrR family transcriptional regulator n=1 Tax=Streptomyces sp. NPDC092296 TaxID=3366012 RepID=UPI00381E068B